MSNECCYLSFGTIIAIFKIPANPKTILLIYSYLNLAVYFSLAKQMSTFYILSITKGWRCSSILVMQRVQQFQSHIKKHCSLILLMYFLMKGWRLLLRTMSQVYLKSQIGRLLPCYSSKYSKITVETILPFAF